jgi:hypothetical protein
MFPGVWRLESFDCLALLEVSERYPELLPKAAVELFKAWSERLWPGSSMEVEGAGVTEVRVSMTLELFALWFGLDLMYRVMPKYLCVEEEGQLFRVLETYGPEDLCLVLPNPQDWLKVSAEELFQMAKKGYPAIVTDDCAMGEVLVLVATRESLAMRKRALEKAYGRKD